MSETTRIVSFREINKAFNEGSVSPGEMMTTADDEARKVFDDPVEAAMYMASFGQALKDLEAAEKDPGVLTSVDNRFASQLQSYIAEHAADSADLPSGGQEAKFDEHDLLGWFGSLFSWIKGLKKHDWIVADGQLTTFPNRSRAAILGDWGTGLYGAPACSDSIEADAEGYQLLLHLGDVYYSGNEGEIRDRFLKFWPSNSTTLANAISRACNSNHEMYTGGESYFNYTLPEFGQQASYFALENDYWILAGLDSAYHTPDLMHNQADLDQGQVDWLKTIVDNAGSRKIILFTHHQPFSHFDSDNPRMVGKLDEILRDERVFAWYWGHEHRCVLFDRHPVWNMFGRCAGHSGFPYFRDDLSAFAEDSSTAIAETRWMSLPPKNLVPGALVLDGPNPYIPSGDGDDPKDYGVQGYMTLKFDDEHLTELVHAPDGTVLKTNTLA